MSHRLEGQRVTVVARAYRRRRFADLLPRRWAHLGQKSVASTHEGVLSIRTVTFPGPTVDLVEVDGHPVGAIGQGVTIMEASPQ